MDEGMDGFAWGMPPGQPRRRPIELYVAGVVLALLLLATVAAVVLFVLTGSADASGGCGGP